MAVNIIAGNYLKVIWSYDKPEMKDMGKVNMTGNFLMSLEISILENFNNFWDKQWEGHNK